MQSIGTSISIYDAVRAMRLITISIQRMTHRRPFPLHLLDYRIKERRLQRFLLEVVMADRPEYKQQQLGKNTGAEPFIGETDPDQSVARAVTRNRFQQLVSRCCSRTVRFYILFQNLTKVYQASVRVDSERGGQSFFQSFLHYLFQPYKKQGMVLV